MDPTGCPPTELDVQLDESRPRHATMASENVSAGPDHIPTEQPLTEPVLSASGNEIQCLMQEKPQTAEATTEPPSCNGDCACVLTNGTQNASSDSRVGNDPFGKHSLDTDFISSDVGDVSDISSQGHEALETAESLPDFVLSDYDHSPRLSTDGLITVTESTTDVHDSQSNENNSDISHEERKDPLVPWNVDPVIKSEIPSTATKLISSGDITDLGDGAFHATKKAKGRSFSNPIAVDNSQEHFALQDRFFEALVRVHEEKKGFFPKAKLLNLVTEDCVNHELNRILGETHNTSQVREYARKICDEIPQPRDPDDGRAPKIKSFKKIFAILVLIEKTTSISKFLEEDVNDLDLPLVKIEEGNSGARFSLRKKRHRDQSLECFRNWSQFNIRAFEEWQWVTVAPFFHKGSRKDVQHFPLQDSVMLPFTSDSRRNKQSELHTVLEGGYGRVFKVQIHPDHHNFNMPQRQTQSFAIKRLNSQNKEDFKKEVEMLKMFSGDTHNHLISLLATYEQFRVYYLIFPWAECDLNGFWSHAKPNPSFDLKSVRWFAKQCEGIAHGLVKIHQYRTSSDNLTRGSREKRYGRHGDLKPENILWFPDPDGGTLKISDFGLSDYTSHSKSYIPKSRVATSMSYRPPECDLVGGVVGQSYDIWTLGCLYLEFITWLLGGWRLVKEFERDRMSFDPMWYDMKTDTFFELVKVPNSRRSGAIAAMVKPTVTAFIQYLHAHEHCTEFLHAFMNMVQYDMLIVKPNKPEERGRISSEQVHTGLVNMLRRGEDDRYLSSPAAWCRLSQPGDEVVEMDITDSMATLMERKVLREYGGPIQERPQ